MQLFDRATTSTPRRTTDGYLVADVRVARTGIQEYLGSEMGRPDMPIVRVYRPEGVVFALDSMQSYAYRPVTNNHPEGGKRLVTADTWKMDSVGMTGAEVARDGEFVRVTMSLMDAAAIADYESGKRELSMGYNYEIDFINGVAADGQPYDAIVTSMKMNHLALVDRARGGAELRIGDSPSPSVSSGQNKGGQMADLMKMMVDGLTIETTEQGKQALEKLQKQVADSASTVQALKDTHSAELAKRDAEIDSLKAKVLTDAQIEARAIARADLVAKAKAVHDADYSGKSDSDIRRTAVVGRIGDAAITGKDDKYVEVYFDIVAKDATATADPVRKILGDGKPSQPVMDARAEFLAHLQSAHLPK